MRDKKVNISDIEKVAIALAELKDQMVFVGGSVAGLYADMMSDIELRETFDVDLTSLAVINYNSYTKLLDRLSQLGFYPDPNGHAICSLQHKGIAVDIMASEDGPIGPANKWYKLGFDDLWTRKVGKEEIKILSAPTYLASKFEAFNSRGGDYRTSHDFEDIIYILDNRSSITDEIKESRPEIKDFLKTKFRRILQNKYKNEFLTAHLDPNSMQDRYEILLDKVIQISNY